MRPVDRLSSTFLEFSFKIVFHGISSVRAGRSFSSRAGKLTTNRWNSQVPSNFRYVVEQTLKEFFKAIQGGKDTEQSWKKSIYKVISRLDDPVPEYFKTPNFLQQLN